VEYSLAAYADLISPEKPPTEHVEFDSSRVRNVLIHEDFLNWIHDPASDQQFVKKARFQIKNLLARGYCPNAKSVVGVAKGWMRAALGGRGGFQYYMWHCAHASEMGQALGLEPGQYAVRVVRHHDETGEFLEPGTLASDYVAFTPSDIEGSGGDLYYTENQQKVAISNKATVQTLRGYPGSGKTTCLWLAANHSSSRQILYITYSESLAREAREFFDAFSQEGVFVDVVTYPELVKHLADERDDAPNLLSVEKAVERMISVLPARKDLVGQWDGHFHELYTELHAHGVGRALPFDFGGVPGTEQSCLDVETFKKLRNDSLGKNMADSAANVLEYLKGQNQIGELFPGPTKSRKLIADINEPPTERLANVGTVLVDEVQDLTLAESLLILNIVARIGVSSGVLPRMVFAGDESQTVRPTDFKWAALKNLITSVLGELAVMDDVGLEQNLRSPAQIAQFVEATRSQYALFEKGDRPAGITYTEVNESLSGRLVYCSLKDEKEWSELTGIFAKLSRARMVYPGFTAPNELLEKSSENSSIVTSSEVKGLDFDVVALIDAGSKQLELRELLEKRIDEPYAEVFGRTMADQYRVAASRASEKLILLDRNGEDHYEEIVRLCDDRKGLSVDLERVDIDQLTHVLEENLDQESLIRSLIQDVKRIIDDQPERAILRVRSIQKQFESFEKLNTVPDDLRFEVVRLRGVSALVGVLRGVEIPSAPLDQLMSEARNTLNQIDLGKAYESVQKLAEAKESWSADNYLDLLIEGVENLEQIEKELPEIRRWHTGKLVTWLDQLLTNDCPTEEVRAKKVLATASKMVQILSKEYGHLVSADQRVTKKWIDSLVELPSPKWRFALGLLESLEIREYAREGDCHVALLSFKEAAEAYLLAGEPAKALQSARSIPDIDLSIRIAKDAGLPELSTLSWLKSLDSSIAEHSVANLGDLTKAEKDQLSKAMKSILK
jgi:hypothetical protein